jgi:hypothetical protein
MCGVTRGAWGHLFDPEAEHEPSITAGRVRCAAVVGLSDGVVTVVDPSMLDTRGTEDLRAALDALPTNPLGVVLVQPLPAGARTRPRRRPEAVTQGEA